MKQIYQIFALRIAARHIQEKYDELGELKKKTKFFQNSNLGILFEKFLGFNHIFAKTPMMFFLYVDDTYPQLIFVYYQKE